MRPSGQSLGGMGLRGAGPQLARSVARSCPSTTSSKVMSAAALRPSFGEETTDQPVSPKPLSQDDEHNFFASTTPSLHARASTVKPGVLAVTVVHPPWDPTNRVCAVSPHQTNDGSPSSCTAAAVTAGVCAIAVGAFTKFPSPIIIKPMPHSAMEPASPAFFIVHLQRVCCSSTSLK